MSAWYPTWLSACGWYAIDSPYSSCTARPSRSTPVVFASQASGVRRRGSMSAPVFSSRNIPGMTTTWVPLVAFVSAATSLTWSHTASHESGRCRCSKTVPGRDLQAAGTEFVGEPGGIGGQVAVGPELDPLVPARAGLVEEALPRHLYRVVGEPDAPRVGRGPHSDPAGALCACDAEVPLFSVMSPPSVDGRALTVVLPSWLGRPVGEWRGSRASTSTPSHVALIQACAGSSTMRQARSSPGPAMTFR